MEDCEESLRMTCNDYASSYGGNWIPMQWQGCNSYTLYNRDARLVLQFRDSTEHLDDGIVRLAKDIYPALAPKTTFVGLLESRCVWQIELLPGDPYLFHVRTLKENQVCQAVEDFARFFAASWRNKQKATNDHIDYYKSLHTLRCVLPKQFQSIVTNAVKHLNEVVQLPLVLTHNDLSCGNILVDPNTGHITGIVDWAGATVQPFGIALWGLQDVIGFCDSSGYHTLYEAARLRTLFRDIFLKEVQFDGDVSVLEWARIIGVLLRYGFTWDEDDRALVPITRNRDLDILESSLHANIFCNNLEEIEIK